MWRGIVSIIALLLMGGAAVVIIPILVIPNTDLHILVPVLQPLHQALACEAGETLDYEYSLDPEGVNETHFRCVDTAGRERDVDSLLQTPANYAIGVFCLGGLLLLAPFLIAVRQGMLGQTGPAVQAALNQGYQQLRELPTEMARGASTTLNASGQQQLAALDKLRQQGLITQAAYDSAKQKLFDDFSAT